MIVLPEELTMLKKADEKSFFVDKDFELLEHFVNFLGVALEIFSGIDDQHFAGVVISEPIFMLGVDHLQVFQRNFIFFLPFAHFCSFVALCWVASQVNNFSFIYGGHCLEIAIQRLENLILSFIHVA